MGLCQKITADRVLADQIFIIPATIIDCDFPFVAPYGATASGTLAVTVTELDFVASGTTVGVNATLMFQKELTISGSSFIPVELGTTFPLEFKIEKTFPNVFCGITPGDLTALGVDLANVRAEVVRLVDVRDSFDFTCGCGNPVTGHITTPAHITETVVTLLKVKLVTAEDLVVGLCPAAHSLTVPVAGECSRDD